MELNTKHLLDLSHTLAGEYLAGFTYPWQALDGIRDLILARREELRESLTARLRRSQAFSGNPEETAYRLVFLLESAVAQAALESSPLLEELLLQALQEAFPAREA